jgi:hypothetical protein
MEEKKLKLQVEQIVIGLLLISIITGCSCSPPSSGPHILKIYDGPELPQNKIAMVTMDMTLDPLLVDGVYPKYPEVNFFPWVLKILPGEHTIQLRFFASGNTGKTYSTSPQSVTFTAEAGKTYKIKDGFSGWSGTWNPYIEEVK